MVRSNWLPHNEVRERMTEIVVDTNVFVHSCNPNTEYFERSSLFVGQLAGSDCILCVDEGLDPDEAQNRSRIWSEYRAHIPPESLAVEILTYMILSGRVKDWPTKVPASIHSSVRKRVADPTDIVFVKVSYNSASECLVSHDFAAFPVEVRDHFRAENIANVIDCYQAPGL